MRKIPEQERGGGGGCALCSLTAAVVALPPRRARARTHARATPTSSQEAGVTINVTMAGTIGAKGAKVGRRLRSTTDDGRRTTDDGRAGGRPLRTFCLLGAGTASSTTKRMDGEGTEVRTAERRNDGTPERTALQRTNATGWMDTIASHRTAPACDACTCQTIVRDVSQQIFAFPRPEYNERPRTSSSSASSLCCRLNEPTQKKKESKKRKKTKRRRPQPTTNTAN